MKKAFCFILKALFVLKVFKFFSSVFSHAEEMVWLEKKVNFKFYDVTAWLTNNCRTHIALNSGSKGNQRMKFGLLTECNMRNIFLEKSYKNVVKELEHKIEQISGSIV